MGLGTRDSIGRAGNKASQGGFLPQDGGAGSKQESMLAWNRQTEALAKPYQKAKQRQESGMKLGWPKGSLVL